jgi:uncharacterized protein YraI
MPSQGSNNPMNRFITSSLVLAATALLPATAQAASPARAVNTVNLRAGPGTHYPAIVTVPAGTRITTFGCIANYSWCDVAWGPNRGWMAASMIQLFHAGRPVAVTPAVIAGAGLAIVAFNRAYWATHYPAQPWYGAWHRYYGRPHPAPVGRVSGATCGPNACGYGAIRRGPYGTTVRHGRITRP